jgi:hypothetical protein
MAESTVNTTASSVPTAGAVSPQKIFWATWFGWMLDGFDSSRDDRRGFMTQSAFADHPR